MQSYDENDQVVRTKFLQDLMKQSNEIQNEFQDPTVKYVKIGKIPMPGEKLEINGLHYQVIMSNEKKKRMTVELI